MNRTWTGAAVILCAALLGGASTLFPVEDGAEGLTAPVLALLGWLRQKSLSGAGGNLLAWALTALIAALPLLLLLLPRGRGSLRWEDGLLPLASALLLALIYGAVNPTLVGSRFSEPGPGVYWWHTIDDTFDKIDLDGLLRDGRVVGVLLYELLSKEKLPADYRGYAKTWLPYFEMLKNSEEHEQAADEIETLLKEVLDRCETLEHIWGTEKIEEHNRLCRLVGGVFSRLMHSTGSAYEQDTSFAYGPLQLLKASAKALPENSPADWSLFYQTTFVRQRNRMVTELRKLLKEIDLEFRNGSDRFGSSRNCDRRMEI